MVGGEKTVTIHFLAFSPFFLSNFVFLQAAFVSELHLAIVALYFILFPLGCLFISLFIASCS